MKKIRKAGIYMSMILLLLFTSAPTYADSQRAITGGYLTLPASKIDITIPETPEVVTEIVDKYDDSGKIITTTTPTVESKDGFSIKDVNQKELIRQADEYHSDVVVAKVKTDSDEISTQIPGSLLDEITKRPNLELAVDTPIGKIVVDPSGVSDLAKQAGGDTLTVTIIRVNSPTEAEQKIAGDDGIVYKVILSVGGKEIETISGTITLLLRADGTLLNKEVHAIHLKDGKGQELTNNRYDKDGGSWITVKTSSAGTYILTHKDNSTIKPEEPAKPNKPGSVNNPGAGKPSQGQNSQTGNGSPQTGDNSNMMLYIGLMAASALALLTAKRKQQ